MGIEELLRTLWRPPQISRIMQTTLRLLLLPLLRIWMTMRPEHRKAIRMTACSTHQAHRCLYNSWQSL